MSPREAPNSPAATAPVFWIDLLRVAAAIAVVFLHVAAEPVVFVRQRSSGAWWTANLIDSALRWCVPIFVMLSGALLLGRRDEPTRVFFARRVRRIAVPLAAWSVVYLGLHAWRRGSLDWGWIGDRLLLGRPEYHMWYVFMILGLYLVTPLLRAPVARADARQLRMASTALLALAALHDGLYSFGFAPPFATVFVMWVPYLGYYLAGHTLYRHPPRRVATGALLVVATGSVAVVAIGTRLLFEAYGVTPAGLYLYEYLSPPVIALSLAVFALGMRAGAPAPQGVFARAMRDVSAATLGIYLIHPLVILLLRRQGLATVPLGAIGVPVVGSCALLLSYVAVSLLRRLPLLRQAV